MIRKSSMSHLYAVRLAARISARDFVSDDEAVIILATEVQRLRKKLSKTRKKHK